MLTEKDYLPVLKLKRAEKHALPKLERSIAARVVPLFEVVECAGAIAPHLDKAFKALDLAVAPFRRFFLDCREIHSFGSAAASDAFARAAASRVPFVPVTSVTRSADVSAALSHRANGLALRLSRKEFESGVVTSATNRFLSKHGLSPGEVDLIVDLEAIDRMIAPGAQALLTGFLRDVPRKGEWRSVTVSACAFPESLGFVRANASGHAERLDWKIWEDLRANLSAFGLTQAPTFSDCGIQHRSGVEGLDFSKVKPAAAIRWTHGNGWHMEKGKSVRDHGGEQFGDLAEKAIRATGARRKHCAGCEALYRARTASKGFGSAEVWRRYGTVHHITSVVEALNPAVRS